MELGLNVASVLVLDGGRLEVNIHCVAMWGDYVHLSVAQFRLAIKYTLVTEWDFQYG